MSNSKQQLQTNNSALDALITRINTAKGTAASLPNAGGGSGGGGSTDICAVEIYANAPVAGDATFYYIDATGTLCTKVINGMDLMMDSVILQCAKNSMIYSPMVFGNMSGDSYNNIQRIDLNCIFVSGDATYIVT